MNGYRPGGTTRLLTLSALLSVAVIAPADQRVLQRDLRIEGKQLYSFTDDGAPVTVVLGDFRMTVGDRTFTGRDAVVWVDWAKHDRLRHDVTAYVEGGDGEQGPRLIRIRHRGRLTAGPNVVKRSLADFPLYRRALEARRTGQVRVTVDQRSADTAPTTAPERRPPPAERRPDGEPVPRPLRDGAGATEPGDDAGKRPADTTGDDSEPVEVTELADGEAEAETETKPPAPALPVTFRANSFTSRMRDGRRVTIARGDVYLSQGNPDSELFLELRAQEAVLFSGPPPAKDVATPYSPRLEGVELPGGDRETISAAYLEGDVIIARGERYVRGDAAYHDFQTDRAIILDPVFRTIQEQRNIPVYVRAEEARALSAREMWFRDAKVTTSDFYTPTYHIAVDRVYLMDSTPYDPDTGEALAEQSWRARMTDTTFNVRNFPTMYLPVLEGDFQQGNTPLRKVQVGSHGDFGLGVETQWHLFRLLGLLRPDGVKGLLDLNFYERGAMAGVDLEYARRDFRGNPYTGYSMLYGVWDGDQEDDFGDERENIDAPELRGRALVRHKHYLPRDWTLQFELSYLCDRNFLEEFFRSEFYAGKEQETLLYAKKQRDNWAFTSLVKARLNDFLTQTESAPDLGFYLIGEPLWKDRLTLYSESHLGLKRFRADDQYATPVGDRFFTRADTRQEVDLPLRFGPVNVVPYATGRATYWGDELSSGDTAQCRPYGQIGVKSATNFWRVYNGVESRLWDLHRLRHIITPEVYGFVSGTNGVEPTELIPMDPGVERHLTSLGGAVFALRQRLQTKRGKPGRRHIADWMRLDLTAGFYEDADREVGNPYKSLRRRRLLQLERIGRFFESRPEYAIGENHLNAEYAWNISDATALLADAYYDTDDGKLERWNAGFAVERDPRLRYYAGLRYIRLLDSAVGTFGVNYRLTRKYTLSVFEQYDFDYESGNNNATSVSIVRKFPRWYAAVTVSYDDREDDITAILSLWPEGIPEVKLGGDRVSILGKSDKN